MATLERECMNTRMNAYCGARERACNRVHLPLLSLDIISGLGRTRCLFKITNQLPSSLGAGVGSSLSPIHFLGLPGFCVLYPVWSFSQARLCPSWLPLSSNCTCLIVEGPAPSWHLLDLCPEEEFLLHCFILPLHSHCPVSYTHLTLPTRGSKCRSRWSPYH